jgi:hypothetical protein
MRTKKDVIYPTIDISIDPFKLVRVLPSENLKNMYTSMTMLLEAKEAVDEAMDVVFRVDMAPRRLAVAMVLHKRLGRGSGLASLPACVLRSISCFRPKK